MESHILSYSSALRLNREAFLHNYRQELATFDDTYMQLNNIVELVSRKRDDQDNSIVGLSALMLIILRQSMNAFNCLIQYQIYDAWLVFDQR